MPFTASHTLAAMPFVYARGLRLDPTCLVVGTMAPDFEYFARVKAVSTVGHTLGGLFVWCIPVTLFSAWLFHRIVKRQAVRIAPRMLAERLAVGAERPWMPAWTASAVAVLVVSALIGACTHLAWDSFTHADTWGTRHIAWLRESYVVPVVGTMRVHRILQHSCSIVSLAVLAILAVRALRRVQPVPVEIGGRALWFACTGIATALAYARMLHNHETDIGSMVVAPLCGLIYGSVAAGLVSRSTISPRRSSAT
jgi:hypothetical protein